MKPEEPATELVALAGDNTPPETEADDRAALLAKLAAMGVTRDDLEAAGIVPNPSRRAPRVQSAKRSEDGRLTMQVSAQEIVGLDEAIGSASQDYHSYAMCHLVNVMRGGQSKDGDDFTFDLNAALAMLSGIGPRDELEAMLAAQMVMTNHTAIRQLTKHHHAETVEAHEAHGNLANKMLRTFTMQVEALAKLRRGGKQIVERVHVSAGGQAVIAGTVNNNRGS